MSARRALAKVGEYFSSTGPNAPILSAANGGECQQNYNLLMSDGFWNGRDAGVGNADIDGGAGNTVFDGNVAQANDQGNYADDFSETLADVSMTYYENDLRPLLNDRVPIQATIDEAEHQHLVTYTIAFGLSGKLDPAVDNPLAAGFSWPEPIANDGMLHGFDDDTGAEVIAYVPNLLSSSNIGDGLHYLTESNYVHKFYVDLTPTLSDVYLSTGGATAWHTILVGGLRGGGRGFYALDVTNPGLFSEANADKLVMWEFSSSDDIDLGYTYSRPVIAYTNAGTWVAIFGNGYNDLGSGEASLFIVDIEKGVDGDWQSGDYIKLSTGVGTAASRNGLASPALADIDGNGTVDRVYAGDLEGNLWAFDMENPNSSQWDFASRSGTTPLPLFTTQANQPITTKPVLAKHPTQPDSSLPSNAPNIMVYFGSGQYLVEADQTSTTLQSFYGVWDKGDSRLTHTDLVQQFFDPSFSEKVLTRNSVDFSLEHGWYFNLDDSGERAVTSPVARADTIFFNSFVPVDDPCAVGGYGYKYAVDMATGGTPSEPAFDSNGDGVVDLFDTASNGAMISPIAGLLQDGFLPEPVFLEDLSYTGEEAIKVKALKDIPVGRFSWQELIR